MVGSDQVEFVVFGSAFAGGASIDEDDAVGTGEPGGMLRSGSRRWSGWFRRKGRCANVVDVLNSRVARLELRVLGVDGQHLLGVYDTPVFGSGTGSNGRSTVADRQSYVGALLVSRNLAGLLGLLSLLSLAATRRSDRRRAGATGATLGSAPVARDGVSAAVTTVVGERVNVKHVDGRSHRFDKEKCEVLRGAGSSEFQGGSCDLNLVRRAMTKTSKTGWQEREAGSWKLGGEVDVT